MVSKTIPVDGAMSEDVLKYAQEHRLVEYVAKAVQATREVFSDAERITVSVKRDPEFGNLYVDINAVIDDDPETEAEKYSVCVGKWVKFMPPEFLEQIALSTSWVS